MSRRGGLLPPGQRLTFARFMELALYHESFGYYAKVRERYPTGAEGDFVTAPSIHKAFGLTFGRLLASLACRHQSKITVADVGAGDGCFLRELLNLVEEGYVERLLAVERSGAGRALITRSCPKVEVVAEIDQAPAPSGPCVVFASELYDALPFHVVEGSERGLLELYVEGKDEGTIAWVADAPSTEELARYLARWGIKLELGQRAEVRLQAEDLHRRLLSWAGPEAVIFIVDYGFPAKTLYNPKARFHGSLVGYRQMKPVFDVLKDPGEIDITAHVNWDDLLGAGQALGFGALVPEPLGLFLTRWGLLDRFNETGSPGFPQEIKILLHPGGMGSDLKVLVQGKGELWACYLALDGERTF